MYQNYNCYNGNKSQHCIKVHSIVYVCRKNEGATSGLILTPPNINFIPQLYKANVDG